jgi:hypothetical protein
MGVDHSAAIWRSTTAGDAIQARPSACQIKLIADCQLPIVDFATGLTSTSYKSLIGNWQLAIIIDTLIPCYLRFFPSAPPFNFQLEKDFK